MMMNVNQDICIEWVMEPFDLDGIRVISNPMVWIDLNLTVSMMNDQK